MESPALDDDICILKHETAYVSPESPVSACAGDESVASHFALVTAYEDIKKRLRDTEKENGLLRRRVKQLEDKVLLSSCHFRPEAPPSEGPQYMNKAFSAYRGIYIEKEDLQMELNKVKKEKLDLERLLKEQLQAKELELLQLRSEMDTSQVMKSLTDTADYWQVDKHSSEMQIHSLQEQLDRLQIENDALHKLCRAGQVRHNLCARLVLHTCYILATPPLHLHYTCTIPALHLRYTCATPPLHPRYICITPALYLPNTCATSALVLRYTPATSALHLHYTCPTPALHLHYSCATPPLHLHYTCPTPA
ncbi:5-azacytidine-induced protein 2-like, partial [Sinocyclocheilus grahami]|uniref:5-azacytidine-induced protein 2-like n=1 Tax=Sinocyclocheilus grahami TaxID=75366 RepID=UPI0007AD32FD